MLFPRSPGFAAALSLFLVSAPAFAEHRTSLRWDELAPQIVGHRVWLTLNDGVRLSGIAREVAPDALKLEVKKTSARRIYPKGLVSVPRSSFTSILLTKPAGHKGLIIGGAAGLAGGTAAGLTLAAIARNEGGTGPVALYATSIIAPVALGFGVGALIDWSARHRTHRILLSGTSSPPDSRSPR